MHEFFTYFTMVLTVIIAIPFYRVLKGPTVFDRLLGAGVIGTKTLVIICLVGFVYGRADMFLDIALTYAIIGFVSIVAITEYFRTERKGGDGTA